jgi:hypothetical protein
MWHAVRVGVKKSLSVREPIWLLAGSFAPQPLLLP